MDLYESLSSVAVHDGAFISLIGGGGKTTLMIEWASRLRSRGYRVLMTTTTKIMSPSFLDYRADRVFSSDDVLSFQPTGPCSVLYALGDSNTNKWVSPPVEQFDILRTRFDVIINEADGSKRLPVKVHTQRDPVVPDLTTYTVSILGLWALGHRTTEVAFGESRDLVVDSSYIQWLLDDPEGLLKGSLPGRRAIVFNGADCMGSDVSSGLKSLVYPSDVFVCTASEREGVIHERIQ